jgi:hypothetical protein
VEVHVGYINRKQFKNTGYSRVGYFDGGEKNLAGAAGLLLLLQ